MAKLVLVLEMSRATSSFLADTKAGMVRNAWILGRKVTAKMAIAKMAVTETRKDGMVAAVAKAERLGIGVTQNVEGLC